MLKTYLVSLTIAACVFSTAATAQTAASVVAKNGSCPKGFSAKGSNCASNSGKVAITRLGSCPKGFKSSGKYCVGDSDSFAMVKSGSCPSGTKSSGKYCIK